MKAIWIKLIRDSFFHKGKIIYLLLAQLIAFFGLSSVYMGNIMVKKDFQENFAKSQPAHLILTYPPEHHPTEFHPLTHPMLSGGEERPMALGEIQTEEGRYMKTLFIGVESIQSPQVNKFSLTHPSASANIYLEQNGSYFFDEEYLENIHIISNANDTTELGPAAWVHDTRLPPSRMEHTLYAYLPISLFNQHFPQATHRWIFKTRINPSDKEGLLKLGNDIKKNWEEAYDLQASFNIPSQDHPHQNIADGIFYLMKLLGGSLGVLGGVFMILILLTWLYPQIPDIGTLKSLGATQGDIQSAYLLFILLLSVIIWIPAAGLGYLVAKAFNTFIAFTQNFSPVENPVSIWQFLSLFGICMAIPVLLSFFPIQSAVRKSVLNAQQWVFTTSHKSLRWISKWFPAARHVYVGNNLLHNLFLFLLSLMLVVTGLSITLSGFNLTQSLKKEMDSLEKNRLFDYAIDVHQADSLSVSGPGFPAEIKQLQYVWVEAVEVQNPVLNIPERLFCAHITPEINIPSNRMIKGEWDTTCTNCLYVTQRLRKDFRHTSPGDSIHVWDHKGESTCLLFGGIIKLPEGSSSALRPAKELNRWNQLYLFSEGKEDLRAGLRAFFSQQTGEIPHISSAALSRQIITDHLEGSFFVITGLGLTALAISLVGIVILINLNLIRREKDIGILKALGARNQQVSHLFEQEVLMVLGVAVGIGVPLSIMLSQSMCFYFGDMVLDFPLVLDVSWVFAGLTSLVFMVLTAASIRYQVRKRVSRKVRYLLQG